MSARHTLRGLAAAALGLGAALAAGAETVAIVGATVHADPGAAPMTNATLVVRDGRIVSIGAGAAPADARLIGGEGLVVTPGLFSGFTRATLADISLDESNDSGADESIHSAGLVAADAFNPLNQVVDVTRIEGVTRFAVVPSAAQTPFAGVGFVADASGAINSIEKERAFLYVEGGERGAELAGGSRAAFWAYLRAAFEDAERIGDDVEGEAVYRGDAGVLREVLRGQLPMLVHVHRAADIARFLDLKRERPAIRLILVGASEAWRVADDLAAARVPIIIDPVQNLPSRFEMIGARSDLATLLHEAGVTFAIAHAPGSDEDFQARLLPQLAGEAAANGLDPAVALAAITTVPAEMFGVASDRMRLRAGGTADFVVWNGDPLEVMSAPVAIFLDGAEQSLASRQTALRDRYHPSRLNAGMAPAYRK